MLDYEKIDFRGKETFKYKLTKTVTFNLGKSFGSWDLISPDGKVVVQCRNSVIAILSGYMWDGTTVIGNFYEDDCTLVASLLHDVLYNAVKNPHDIKVPFSLVEADKLFANHLRVLYKQSGNFFQRHILPSAFKWGLLTIGIPWKFGNNNYYKLNKLA